MSEKKFFEMQQQIRRDNEDLQGFLRDLNNWETDIKQKDNELRHDKTTDSAAGDQRILPPVRNRQDQLHQKKVRKKKKAEVEKKPLTNDNKNQNGSETKKKRIKAYDYRSWDKFDVDKACAEVDSGEGEKESSDSTNYETDSDAEREMEEKRRRVQEAIAEKDKGNALFKQGKYTEAVLCYSAGMEADPTNGILPANRAMALLKLKRYSEAETDCNKAISIDCTYVKAYARRGSARIELGKLDDAKKDFHQVLNLESTNKQAVAEIIRIDKLLKEKQEKLKKSQEPSNIVKAIEKPIHLRSNKPLKRIVIEEIGTGSDSEADSPRTAPNNKQKSAPENSVSTKGKESSVCDKTASTVTDKTSVEKANRQSEKSRPKSEASTKPQPKSSSESEPFIRTSSPPSIPPTPHSSFQLEADLKKLDKYPQQMYQYFKQISPEKLPVLFQQSLDSTLLMKILALLQKHYIPNIEPVYAVLRYLSQVKRFDMNVMFMSKKEKQVAADLLEYCKTRKTQTDEELNALTKKYGL